MDLIPFQIVLRFVIFPRATILNTHATNMLKLVSGYFYLDYVKGKQQQQKVGTNSFLATQKSNNNGPFVFVHIGNTKAVCLLCMLLFQFHNGFSAVDFVDAKRKVDFMHPRTCY